MLELENVTAYYGNSPALQNVDMHVESGEFMSVLGRNGGGKTTLMRAILGLMDKVTGSIELDGKEINNKRTDQRALAGIGYVPQGRGILPKFTVRENLMMGTFASQSNSGTINEWVFELFPILRDFLGRRGGNLSGGQQQQLAIARALLSDPKVILLDEPTEGIQPNIVEQIEEVLVKLNREHRITVVLVEQNVEFARRASQKFVLLDRGSVASHGSIDELSDDLVHRHMAV
ncbi:urea ABC transporter ATP-binding subunit UrtE [Pelagibius litoralis]|uniref:Urea ABC transporter ATP-binding subunit UrtE n=1 Tax=Pelagibius litoralis TaxID=374515 RepID=A0A967EYQ6_9PROT|nr:urea ABC transporter ATP-binding subunit UrtE [Pelagibius litoralis]NIA69896.1 urea ABC transporter ATP-binding subunit UrtE [Pelagibius litoralis]